MGIDYVFELFDLWDQFGMRGELAVVLRLDGHDADFLRERRRAGQFGRENLYDFFGFVIGEPIGRVVEAAGEIAELTATIAVEGNFLEEVLGRTPAVLEHPGEAECVFEKCDAIEAREIDGANFCVFRKFEGETNVGCAFEFFGDATHALANGKRGPFAVKCLGEDAIKDVGAFEWLEFFLGSGGSKCTAEGGGCEQARGEIDASTQKCATGGGGEAGNHLRRKIAEANEIPSLCVERIPIFNLVRNCGINNHRPIYKWRVFSLPGWWCSSSQRRQSLRGRY